jgi:large subunit ribosomal protein L16
MLQPKLFKYKKSFKSNLKNYSYKKNDLLYGEIGLKALQSGYISAKQLESARQSIQRKIKRKGKLWFRIFPSIPITKKPIELRMGKGKGPLSHWAVKLRKGQMIFEMSGVNTFKAKLAFRTGGAKLPIKTKTFSYE